jgi:predicted ATPase with chaperone activity
MELLFLSARDYDVILKVPRTIADLRGDANLYVYYILVAIQYRSLNIEVWLR